MEPIYTETQAGRFEVAVWKEREDQRSWYVQVLDLRPYTSESQCRDLEVDFAGMGAKAFVSTDHSEYRLRKEGDAWACPCQSRGICYHVRAVIAAERHSLSVLRAWLLAHPYTPQRHLIRQVVR